MQEYIMPNGSTFKFDRSKSDTVEIRASLWAEPCILSAARIETVLRNLNNVEDATTTDLITQLSGLADFAPTEDLRLFAKLFLNENSES